MKIMSLPEGRSFFLREELGLRIIADGCAEYFCGHDWTLGRMGEGKSFVAKKNKHKNHQKTIENHFLKAMPAPDASTWALA